jgi:hypothetical protein
MVLADAASIVGGLAGNVILEVASPPSAIEFSFLQTTAACARSTIGRPMISPSFTITAPRKAQPNLP